MRGSCSLLTINQLSKTILLQSCLPSLIWPLEYWLSVDGNWSNMTSPPLICRYSDVGKLMPTAESGCISLLPLYSIDIPHLSFLGWEKKQASVVWKWVHSVLLIHRAGNFEVNIIFVYFWSTATRVATCQVLAQTVRFWNVMFVWRRSFEPDAHLSSFSDRLCFILRLAVEHNE